MIRRNNKLIECTECHSTNIVVVEVRDNDDDVKCEQCNTIFPLSHPHKEEKSMKFKDKSV